MPNIEVGTPVPRSLRWVGSGAGGDAGAWGAAARVAADGAGNLYLSDFTFDTAWILSIKIIHTVDPKGVSGVASLTSTAEPEQWAGASMATDTSYVYFAGATGLWRAKKRYQ